MIWGHGRCCHEDIGQSHCREAAAHLVFVCCVVCCVCVRCFLPVNFGGEITVDFLVGHATTVPSTIVPVPGMRFFPLPLGFFPQVAGKIFFFPPYDSYHRPSTEKHAKERSREYEFRGYLFA